MPPGETRRPGPPAAGPACAAPGRQARRRAGASRSRARPPRPQGRRSGSTGARRPRRSMPPTKGCTTRSTICAPKWSRTKSADADTPRRARRAGGRAPGATLRLGAAARRGGSPGANAASEGAGSGDQSPRGGRGIGGPPRAPPRPARRQGPARPRARRPRATTPGASLGPPRPAIRPPARCRTEPPRRGPDSSRRTACPAWARRQAAVRPVTPPPRTAIFIAPSLPGRDRVDHGLDAPDLRLGKDAVAQVEDVARRSRAPIPGAGPSPAARFPGVVLRITGSRLPWTATFSGRLRRTRREVVRRVDAEDPRPGEGLVDQVGPGALAVDDHRGNPSGIAATICRIQRRDAAS